MSTEHTVENQLQLPVIEHVNGDTYTFPRLELDDLINWANEVRTLRRAEAEQRYRADNTLSPFDRHRLLQEVLDRGVELGILLSRAYEPAGIRKVLVMSLKKGGKADAEALAMLSKIHYQRQANLAIDVISPPAPPPPPKKADDAKEGEPPLSEVIGEPQSP